MLLQESYVRKQGESHTFYGLRTEMKVAATQNASWALVAVSNPRLQMIFVSQLNTTHCVCAEVQAYQYISYHVTSSIAKKSKATSGTSKRCFIPWEARDS